MSGTSTTRSTSSWPRSASSPDGANRLKALVSGSLDKAAFSDADFVIEAVFEELGVKQQVFAELEQHVSPEAILATNTSSLSITAMASKLQHPERVVGFHFFNPVAVLPLLEIVRGEQTDDASLATAFSVGKQLKKSSVLVKDAPAFVVNRLLLRFLGEVLVAVDEGTPFEVADRALEPLGLPMTPLMLMQLVGPAIALHVGETMHEAFPDRFSVSENLAKFVKAGKKGVWMWDAQGNQSRRPRGRRAVDAGRPRRPLRSRCASGPCPRSPRRSGSCSTRAWSPRRRTSTCA